jgi:hypothetical protein
VSITRLTHFRSSDSLSPPPSRPDSPTYNQYYNGRESSNGTPPRRPEPLVKQTYSTSMTHPVTHKIKKFHVVAYSSKRNPQGDGSNPLPLPHQLPNLANIKITPGIWPDWETRRDDYNSRRTTSARHPSPSHPPPPPAHPHAPPHHFPAGPGTPVTATAAPYPPAPEMYRPPSPGAFAPPPPGPDGRPPEAPAPHDRRYPVYPPYDMYDRPPYPYDMYPPPDRYYDRYHPYYHHPRDYPPSHMPPPDYRYDDRYYDRERGRAPPGEDRRPPGDERDPRAESREPRDSREPREPREPREGGDAAEPREPREAQRDPREPPRDPRDVSRDPRDGPPRPDDRDYPARYYPPPPPPHAYYRDPRYLPPHPRDYPPMRGDPRDIRGPPISPDRDSRGDPRVDYRGFPYPPPHEGYPPYPPRPTSSHLGKRTPESRPGEELPVEKRPTWSPRSGAPAPPREGDDPAADAPEADRPATRGAEARAAGSREGSATARGRSRSPARTYTNGANGANGTNGSTTNGPVKEEDELSDSPRGAASEPREPKWGRVPA